MRPVHIDVLMILVLLVLIIIPLFEKKPVEAEIITNQAVLVLSPDFGSMFGGELTEMLLNEFAQRHPDILIHHIDADSEEQPDIIFFEKGEFNVLAGVLLELNSFTNYDSGSQQLAVPLVSFINLLYYNIEILSAAGFDRPPKTRDEFITQARTVSQGAFNAAGAPALFTPANSYTLTKDILSWIWAGGGDIWSNGDKPSINSRRMINDITFLGNLNRVLNAGTAEDNVEQFAQGKTALMIASTRYIPHLRERMGDSAFGITTIPESGAGGRYNIGISSIYAGLNSGGAHHDEAWSFLEFLAEKSSLLCAYLKAVPGVVSNFFPGDYVRNDPFYSKAWDIFESAMIVEDFSGKPGAQQYEAAFIEELQLFFEGGRTAQQTAAAIQRRWDEVDVGD